MWPIVLVCFFMIHQGASMPLTQEDIDKWMPYILEKMETKFLTSNQFIPYKKKILEMDAIIKGQLISEGNFGVFKSLKK